MSKARKQRMNKRMKMRKRDKRYSRKGLKIKNNKSLTKAKEYRQNNKTDIIYISSVLLIC